MKISIESNLANAMEWNISQQMDHLTDNITNSFHKDWITSYTSMYLFKGRTNTRYGIEIYRLDLGLGE